MVGSRGDGGTDPPLKNHNTIGFSSKYWSGSPENHKVTKPVFNVGPSYVRQAFRWRADVALLMVVFGSSLPSSVTYIRVTRNSNKIPILNSNSTVVYLTQVNKGNSISFIYTIGFYRCFGIRRVISLLFTQTFNTFINTEII